MSIEKEVFRKFTNAARNQVGYIANVWQSFWDRVKSKEPNIRYITKQIDFKPYELDDVVGITYNEQTYEHTLNT